MSAPPLNKNMFAFMGRSLPARAMKQWVEEAECSFLSPAEKQLAKELPPRYFWHCNPQTPKQEYPKDLTQCKSISVPHLSSWEDADSFLYDLHHTAGEQGPKEQLPPQLEELQSFSSGFKMPIQWKKKKSSKKRGKEMGGMFMHGRFEEPEANSTDYLNLLKSSFRSKSGESKPDSPSGSSSAEKLGVEEKVRKRSSSAVKLFRGKQADKAKQYEEIVDDNGIKHIKGGTLALILINLVTLMHAPQEDQKKEGKKMFFGFIHAYRRVETPSNVLAFIKQSYEMGEDAIRYISTDGSEGKDGKDGKDSEEKEGGSGSKVKDVKEEGSTRKRKSVRRSLGGDHSSSGGGHGSQFKQNLLGFLISWIEERFVPDFTTPYVEGTSKKTVLYGELLQFLNTMNPPHKTAVKSVLDSQDEIGVQLSASNLLGQARSASGSDEKHSRSRRGTLSKNTSKFFNVMNARSKALPSNFSFLDMVAEELSEIMTKEDSRLFANLSVDEFSGQAWSSKMESGVGVLTHRWNKLVRWVASEVVNNANQKQRTEILKRFITILDEVFKNNNFFAAMAVLSGLNHSAVQRMKKTWRALPEKYMKDLSHIEEELSFSQSFRRYRELLSEAIEKNKPCIPFLAVHTKDLLFINEAKGNPEYFAPKVINFEKLSLIGNIVYLMKMSQKYSKKYELVVLNAPRHEAITDFMGRLPNTLPEESLYPTSLHNEPSQDV